MSISPDPAQAPVLVCYSDIPRDLWARTLLRARQLGAHCIITSVSWGWHAPTPGLIDLDGTSGPQRDLVSFVALCDRLNLSLVLNFGAIVGEGVLQADIPVWLGPAIFSEHTPRSKPKTELPAEYLAAARQWVAVCSGVLLPHQSPDGPIAELRLASDSQLRGWLQDEGWTIPIGLGPPGYADIASRPAALEDGFANQARLLAAGYPLSRSSNRPVPPMLRSDTSARPSFWRAKSMRMLTDAAGLDIAAARSPADLGLLAGARGQPLAQRLADAGISFDRIDPANATLAQLARYALLIASGLPNEQPGVWDKLAGCTNLAVVGELPGAPASALRLAADTSADRIGELIESRGGHARYAWADIPALEVHVYYGSEHTFLFIHNQQAAAYNGMLAYRAPGGDVLHVHVGIGAGRSGIVMLREDEVVGAAVDGDGAEGGWLARGLTSSMVFNAGAGGVAPCGLGLLLMAPQSGRFQIRRSAGWADMQAYRLLLSGELIPARAQADATHLLVAYAAEDDCGQTDMYIALPGPGELPDGLRAYLSAPLHARALDLERAAALAEPLVPEAATGLRDAASALAASAAHVATIADYTAAWRDAERPIQSLLAALDRANASPAATAAATIRRIVHLLVGEAG